MTARPRGREDVKGPGKQLRQGKNPLQMKMGHGGVRGGQKPAGELLRLARGRELGLVRCSNGGKKVGVRRKKRGILRPGKRRQRQSPVRHEEPEKELIPLLVWAPR